MCAWSLDTAAEHSHHACIHSAQLSVPIVQCAFMCDAKQAVLLRLQGMPCTYSAQRQGSGQGMPRGRVKATFSPI